MKILRVVSDLYPAVVGGLGLHAHEMSKQQAKLGNEVTVYTSNTDRRLRNEFKDGYNIIRFKTILKIGGNSFMPMLFFKLFHTKNDFDIIHAHSYFLQNVMPSKENKTSVRTSNIRSVNTLPTVTVAGILSLK